MASIKAYDVERTLKYRAALFEQKKIFDIAAAHDYNGKEITDVTDLVMRAVNAGCKLGVYCMATAVSK